MPPLQVEGRYLRVAAGGTEGPLESEGRLSGAGADIQNPGPTAAESAHPRDQMPFERPRAAPPAIDETQVFEGPPHLFGGQGRIIEVFGRGAARRDEKTQAGLDSRSALFFEPNPMQLQSAVSNEDGRAKLAT